MPERTESESRRLLRRLRDSLAAPGGGQDRLDRITHHIADSMRSQVCSVYLFRDADTLELCATEGLRAEAVHRTRLRLGEGLVGRVARTGRPINTADAPAQPGFRYMPETGEEVFPSFLGVPIQRVGEKLGVLVVQSREAREYTEDEVYGLEVVAMVLAEMAELGAFLGNEAQPSTHRFPAVFRGDTGQEGAAEGQVWLHEPRVVITNPVGDDPDKERARLAEAVAMLRQTVDQMVAETEMPGAEGEAVLEAYRMFANSKSWLRRMEEDIDLGLSAEAAVEKEQSQARARLESARDAEGHAVMTAPIDGVVSAIRAAPGAVVAAGDPVLRLSSENELEARVDLTAAELVETLYRGLADNSVGKTIDTLLRNDLILLDELGFAPLDDTGAQLLFRFVAAAYERRSLGVASHHSFEDWGRFLPEHTTAVSLLDRLLHHCHTVVTDGDSYRMKQARQNGGTRLKSTK